MKTINFGGHHWKMAESKRGGDYAILRREPTATESRSHRGIVTALEVKVGDLKGYNRADVINFK